MGTQTVAEPGGREPAPEPLRLIQRFVNTNDREGGRDALATPAGLTRWLRNAGLPVGRLEADDLERAVRFREALRALLRANNGQTIDTRALAVLDAEAITTAVALRFTATTPVLLPRGSGLDRALGQLLAIVFAAMLDGSWPRLKACRRDICQWTFYDHSKNRSGAWCTMDICGNRIKTSSYWRRTHPRAPGGSARRATGAQRRG
jgi:predicted RNA-binding Zn ribbon-like protein